METITYATGNLVWGGLDSACSGNAITQFCIFRSAIYDFGQQYFWGWLKNMAYYVYDKAFTIQVQDWAMAVIFIMLFLSFIVGFIFFAKKR